MLKLLEIHFVVKDLDSAVHRFYQDFGIGPWNFNDYGESAKNHIAEVEQYGEQFNLNIRAALADVGGVALALIEPLDRKSVFGEFLATRGEGFYNLCFESKAYEADVKALIGKGYREILNGNLSGVRLSYFDTKKELGFIHELVDIPDDVVLPMPDKTYP